MAGLLCFLALAQQLPARWSAEKYFWQSYELVEHGAFSAAHQLARAYLERVPSLLPQAPPSVLPGWWAQYALYDLLREGSAEALEAYAQAVYPAYRSDLARFHGLKYAFLRQKYEEVLAIGEALDYQSLPKGLQAEGHFMMGYAAFVQKKPDKALKHLRPLSEKLGPFHDPANLYLGILYYERGDYRQAASHLEAVQTKAPYAQAAPLWLAYCLAKLPDPMRLAQAAQRWQNLNPPPLYADTLWPFVAMSLAQAGLCGAADSLKVPHPLAKLWIGICWNESGEYARAVASWDSLSDREDSLGGWAALGLANAFTKQNRLEEALIWAKAAAIRPGPPRTLSLELLGFLAWKLQNPDVGISALSALLKENLPPQKAQTIRLYLAYFYILDKNYDEALKVLGSDTSEPFVSARQQALLLKGFTYLRQEAWKAAQEAFMEAAAQNGALTLSALLWSAEAAYRLGQYPQAEAQYKHFLQHPGSANHPQKEEAQLFLAWTLLRQNKAEEALKLLTPLKKAHKSTDEKGQQIRFLLASAYFLQKKYQEAIPLLEELLRADPSQTRARYYLALSFMRLERYRQADSILQAGSPSEAGADELLILRAKLCSEWLSRPSCTRETAQLLIRHHPNSLLRPLAEVYLGISLAEEGNRQEAILHLKSVLQKYPDHTEAAQMALEALRSLLSPTEYDQVYADFVSRLPAESTTRLALEQQRLEALAAQERWDKLRTEAKKLQQLYPHFGPAQWWAAYSAEMQKDTAEALASYQTLINDPTYGLQALERLVRLNEAQNAYPTAIAWQETLLTRLPPQNLPYKQAIIRWAELNLAANQPQKARQALLDLSADSLLPAFVRQQALLQLALSEEKTGDLAKAIDYLREATRLEKNLWAAEALYHTARLLHQEGRFNEAREAIYMLRDQYVAYPTPRAASYLILARIFIAENKRTSAKKLLENLIETAPTVQIKQEAQALLESLPPPPPPPKEEPKKKKSKKR